MKKHDTNPPYYLAYEKRYQAVYAAGFAVESFREEGENPQCPFSISIWTRKKLGDEA